jgi:cell division protein FtsQ
MTARRWWLAGALGLAAVLVGVGLWLAFFSQVLAVAEVRATGVDAADGALVVDAAAIPSGIPLARVDVQAAADRVVTLPWVRSATVSRAWPDAIEIAVVPRNPTALDAASGQAIDEDGIVFAPPQGMPAGLIPVRATGAGRAEAARAARDLPESLARRILRIDGSTKDDLVFALKGGSFVRWGSAERTPFKAQVLEQLLPRNARIYDVSAPELPTTVGER